MSTNEWHFIVFRIVAAVTWCQKNWIYWNLFASCCNILHVEKYFRGSFIVSDCLICWQLLPFPPLTMKIPIEAAYIRICRQYLSKINQNQCLCCMNGEMCFEFRHNFFTLNSAYSYDSKNSEFKNPLY